MFNKARTGGEKAFNRILLTLLAAIFLAVTLHVVTQLSLHRGAPSGPIAIDLANRLSLDAEMSVPTWLAALLAITAGTIAIIVGRVQLKTGPKAAWYLLAAASFIISVDEVSALHELLLQDVHAKAGYGTVQTLAENAWLIILPFVAAAGIAAIIYWAIHLPRRTFWRLTAAFGIYALGAVAVEIAAIPVDKGVKTYTVGYVVVEETLELLGLWLMVRAGLLHVNESEENINKALAKLL